MNRKIKVAEKVTGRERVGALGLKRRVMFRPLWTLTV